MPDKVAFLFLFVCLNSTPFHMHACLNIDFVTRAQALHYCESRGCLLAVWAPLACYHCGALLWISDRVIMRKLQFSANDTFIIYQ